MGSLAIGNTLQGKSQATALAATTGYVLLTLALVLSPGQLYLPSLVLLALSLGLVVAASCRRCELSQNLIRQLLPIVLRYAAIFSVLGLGFVTLGFAYVQGTLCTPLVAAILVLGVLVANAVYMGPLLPHRRFEMVVLAYLFLASWLMCFSQRPAFDMWQCQQQACGFLLQGKNPYAAEYSDMDDPRLYAPTMVKDGRVQTFPYPPLSLLLDLPGYLLGDVRWSLLGAVVATAVLMAEMGRRFDGGRSPESEHVAIAFLCHPLGLVILYRGWSEPFLALAIGFCLWGAVKKRHWILVAGLAAVLGAKQYGLLWVFVLWWGRCLNWRGASTAVVLAVSVALPFLLWNPWAFWNGVGQSLLQSPFRGDSLSVLAAVADWTGWQPPAAIGFLTALVVALAVSACGPGSLSRSTLGGAGVFLAFFLFSKQGHLNYYWLVGSLLAMAVAVSQVDLERDQSDLLQRQGEHDGRAA